MFRRGLIERIGVARVEALESDNTPRKYSIEELLAIKASYRAKIRASNVPVKPPTIVEWEAGDERSYPWEDE